MTAIKPLLAIHGTRHDLLTINDHDIACCILDNGIRALSVRGIQMALGLGQRHGALHKALLERRNINAFLDDALRQRISNPLPINRPHCGGKQLVAYEADVLLDIVDKVLLAWKTGVLSPKQCRMASICEAIKQRYNKALLIRHIDDITGYQKTRERRLINALLKKSLTPLQIEIARHFPDEFFQQIFRLNEWDSVESDDKSSIVLGAYVEDIAFKRLDADCWVAPNKEGNTPLIEQHISNLIFLMRSATAWSTMMPALNRAAPQLGATLSMNF